MPDKGRDVTKDVSIGWVDDECAQLKKCVCGACIDVVIGIYTDDPWVCDECGRQLIIAQKLTVLSLVPPDSKLQTTGNIPDDGCPDCGGRVYCICEQTTAEGENK